MVCPERYGLGYSGIKSAFGGFWPIFRILLDFWPHFQVSTLEPTWNHSSGPLSGFDPETNLEPQFWGKPWLEIDSAP